MSKKLAATFKKHFDSQTIQIPEGGLELNYELLVGFGFMKPFAVRLPINLIASLEVIAEKGPWGSKQEMIYEMLHAAVTEIVQASPDLKEIVGIECDKALTDWKADKAKEAE